MSIQIVTFGCRLNSFESEVIRNNAESADLNNVIIFNTCAVTGEAVRQARQSIRKLRREHPNARIVVTGCAAQIEPETFAKMEEVDNVFGNAEKLKARSYTAFSSFQDVGTQKVQVNDISQVREIAPHLIKGMNARVRAFVQVQNGCDHRCTFCIIPYGRGPSRSSPMGAVVKQIRTLVATGTKEVVLSGVDITSYGHDLPGTPSLGFLVKAILKHVPELARLRISSIDVIEADDDLIDAFASEPRLMPHLHLSLQAGHDLTLKRMKRRHLRSDAIAFCRSMKAVRPDIVFGADLIAGFPTETQDMFQASLDLIEECELTHLHVFPYSSRKGTPAARMPQIPVSIRKQRAHCLRAKGAYALKKALDKKLNTLQSILIEQAGVGRTEDYFEVRGQSLNERGSIITKRIKHTSDSHLLTE